MPPTHLFDQGRFQPQGALATLFALAFAPDELRAGLAQEGLVVHRGLRESPMHSLWGSEGVHRPPVEAASLPLELSPAAGAVFVLRPHGAPAATSRPAGSVSGGGGKFAGRRLLGVFLGVRERGGSNFIPSRTVYLRTHGRFRELYGQSGLLRQTLLGFNHCKEASLRGDSSVSRRSI